jgi:hypothetical protein
VAKKAFPLRISETVWDALRRWSEDELRSVNAQIEYVLREALRQAGRLPEEVKGDGSGKPDNSDPR